MELNRVGNISCI